MTTTTTPRTSSSTRRSRSRCTRGSVATTKTRSSNRKCTSSKRNGSSSHNHPSQPAQKAEDDHNCDDADCPHASASASTKAFHSMSNTNSSIVFVDTVDDLEQITQEHVQLAIWRRHAIPKFVQTVHQLSATATATDFDPVSCIPNFECIVQPEETYELLKAHLYCPYNLRSKQYQVFQDPELFELIRDIAGLVTVFATIAKTECVNIKLEVVTDNGCQYWHQDSVPQRMVVTYFGPCTEFIPPDDSITTNNNNKMGMTVLAQYRTTNICPAQYQPTSLTHYDVAVFKGRGATTEESPLLDSTKGIVHRSPRLFATNDDDEDEDDNENENDDDDENDGSDDNDHGTKNGSQSGTFRWVLVLDIPVEGWHY